MTSLWSVDSEQGTNLSADELIGVLATHHARVAESWQGFSPEQWGQQSRNPDWSVHETARHVADAMESIRAKVLDEASPFPMEGFDPRTTPDTWMAASADEGPERTIERFAVAAQSLRDGVGRRMEAGDDQVVSEIYGPVHWSVMIVHLLWDSWLHERDVLLPLGLPAQSPVDEQRLAGIYGLMMTTVMPRFMKQPFATAIRFTGNAGRTVEAAHESGRLSSTETEAAETELIGDLPQLVDALSGRGTPLKDLLPGAPEQLGDFATYMAS